TAAAKAAATGKATATAKASWLKVLTFPGGGRFLCVPPSIQGIARLGSGLVLSCRGARLLAESARHGAFFFPRQLRKVVAIFGQEPEDRLGEPEMSTFFQLCKDAVLFRFFDRH